MNQLHTAEAVTAHEPGRSAPDIDGLRRAEPFAVGVDAGAVVAFLDDMAAAGLELDSFMLYRRGAVAAEGWWWPYRSDVMHMLHSSTKSFVGIGLGIAIDEGLLTLDDPVLKFFPDRIAEPSANLAAMTVESLLTQTCGHDIGISGAQWRPIKTSWITEFLKHPVAHAPGTQFAYSSATSFMISAIITQVTGMPLSEFLRPRLFEPMGITNWHWDIGPEGINPGGNGLSLTTADFLKLGVLLLHGGEWQGRRLVSESWARRSGRLTHGNPYGYHWWVLPRDAGFCAAGKFGQFAFVFPALDAVLVYTSGVSDNAETRNAMFRMALKHIHAMCPDDPSPAAAPVLAARLAGLRILAPLEPRTSPSAARISGREIHCEANGDGVVSLKLTFSDDECLFEMVDHRGRHAVRNGLSDWCEGSTTITGGYLHHEYEPDAMRVVAGGWWTGPDRFEMVWQFIESGFRDTVVLTFAGDTVVYERSVNVNSGALFRPALAGMLRP